MWPSTEATSPTMPERSVPPLRGGTVGLAAAAGFAGLTAPAADGTVGWIGAAIGLQAATTPLPGPASSNCSAVRRLTTDRLLSVRLASIIWGVFLDLTGT